MKTALVTGISGYLGSHVSKKLKLEGWKVVGIDIVKPKHDYYNVFKILDVRDYEDLSRLFCLTKFDAVFHFAGRIEIGESIKHPTVFWETNVAGTCHILNCMKESGAKNIIFSSSAGVYKPDRINKLFDIPISEVENTTFEHNPYSASKLACEYAIKQSGLKYVIFRYFNLAGADPENDIGENHEPETHLIPRIFQNLNSFELYGDDFDTPDGTCVRDYVHVSDVADAHISGIDYLMNGGESQLMNLGTGKGHSNLEIMGLICERLHLDIKYETLPRREGDPARLVADITLAEKVLNYRPKHDIISILKTAYEWHKKHDKKI
jgi:UDP-glucose-4-epimerase GalE